MRTASEARNSGFQRSATRGFWGWLRAIGPGTLVLGAPALAGLPACDQGAVTSSGTGTSSCQGSECPLLVGEPVVVATPSSDVVVLGLTLARSSDGNTLAAGWSELSDQERPHVATSADGGLTFGAAVQVDAPDDVELSYLRLLLPDGAGLLAGAVAHFPDPMGESWHGWPKIYRLASSGTAFEQLADLKSAAGERTFTQGAFAASADGKTLVWAWLDVTPADWLTPDSAPTQAVLASVSKDSGKTYGAPQVVSTTPFLYATRIAAFIRDGRAGVVYSEARDIPGEPVKVGVAALAMTGEDGQFQKPVLVAADAYGAVPAGGAVGADGAAPGAALGMDGSIHVAWWSAMTVGLWYAVSQDGKTFSEPARVLETDTPTPANVRVAVDGSGAAWIAALDQESVRVVQVLPGKAPIEIAEAAAPLGSTGDTFDIAGLPGEGAHGAMQLWLGAAPDDGTGSTSRPVQLRRIAP
jgi:hypothetical protein